MKVTIDLENLEQMIQDTLENNAESAIKIAVNDAIKKQVDKVLSSQTSRTANQVIEEYIREYLQNAKIHVGDGWNDEEVKEYTVEQYLKKQINDIFETKSFVTRSEDRWGNMRETTVTFQDFILKHFNIDEILKPKIEKMVAEVKKDVNSRAKEILDTSMKNALADNVFAIVSASETYRKISDGVKMLGGGNG